MMYINKPKYPPLPSLVDSDYNADVTDSTLSNDLVAAKPISSSANRNRRSSSSSFTGSDMTSPIMRYRQHSFTIASSPPLPELPSTYSPSRTTNYYKQNSIPRRHSYTPEHSSSLAKSSSYSGHSSSHGTPQQSSANAVSSISSHSNQSTNIGDSQPPTNGIQYTSNNVSVFKKTPPFSPMDIDKNHEKMPSSSSIHSDDPISPSHGSYSVNPVTGYPPIPSDTSCSDHKSPNQSPEMATRSNATHSTLVTDNISQKSRDAQKLKHWNQNHIIKRTKSKDLKADDPKFHDINRVRSRDSRDVKSTRVKERRGSRHEEIKRTKSRDGPTNKLTRRYSESHLNYVANGNNLTIDHTQHHDNKPPHFKLFKKKYRDETQHEHHTGPFHKSNHQQAQRRTPRTSRLINSELSRTQSRRSSRSSLHGDVLKKVKNSETVAYPQGVHYRPGRIQSITGEQEVQFKQLWAYLLKTWGYTLNMTTEDIQHLESFVASSNTSKRDQYIHPLKRVQTKQSVLSFSSTKTFKKRRQFWKFRRGANLRDWASCSDRLRDVQIKSYIERYEPAVFPSKDVINVYVNHYNLTYEFDDDYISSEEDYDFDESKENDSSDNSSMETFVTANSNVSGIVKESPKIKKTTSRTSNGVIRRLPRDNPKKVNGVAVFHTMYHTMTVEKTPIDCHEELLEGIASMPPAEVHRCFVSRIRNDLMDNFLLRYARARNFNTLATLEMLHNTASWRTKFGVDKWFLEGDAPSYLNKTNGGFLKNFLTEKSWIRGHDYEDNPIFWFQARKHFGSDYSVFDVQRYAVVMIEWCALYLQDVHKSRDTFTIVFDLTGFTLKNADYTSIKFLAEILESDYPETLGKILVHNAPWIFSTVWNIIKHWIHPVIAAKIYFTKNYYDLLEFIDSDSIPDYLGGTDISEHSYPVPGPNDGRPPKRKDANYRRLRKTRDNLIMRFIDCTRKWVESTNSEISALYLEEKIALNVELSNNYLELDPYIRVRGVYDRNHTLSVMN